MRDLLSEWHQSLQRVEANLGKKKKKKRCTLCSSNPLVSVNEVTSFYPSWATRGTDEFKWITVPRVHFSIRQDPHCISRLGLSLLPSPNLPLTTFFANQIVTRGIFMFTCRVMGQMSPSSEIQENTSAPKEHCWVYTLASVCKSLVNLSDHSNGKDYIYILVCHLPCKNII